MKNELIALIFGIMMSMPYSEAQKQPIHPKILKTVDYCLDGFINEMNDTAWPINKYLNKDFDSINIRMLFYLDSNNTLCYDVFTFHQLANDSIPLLGCYPIDNRTLLYVYDMSGLASNFIDTAQLQQPRPSRLDHVIKIKCPEDAPILEGLDYYYVIGYRIITKEKKNGIVIKKIKRRNQVNEQYYSYYPKLKLFLGL